MRWFLGLCLAVGVSSRASGAEPVDFARDVQPILAKHCFECHGEKMQKSSLRLDSRAAAIAGGDNGPAIEPGKSDKSRLIEAVTGADPDFVMPPKGPRLSAAEIAVLRTWIDQGAVGPAAEAAKSSHWSFQPVVRPPLPKVAANAPARNPIDQFVIARLEQTGLAGSPEADRVALVRRVFLDVLGLPPTPDQISQFVADSSPDAYEKLVESALKSPHYGERWARHWLDIVRFGETNGFERNLERPNAWPYRDYVIDSFNADKPYDRFVVEQLAGDSLGIDAATGFLVAGVFDDVGSNDPKYRAIQRQDVLTDIVNGTGTTFLGLTLGCARCHTHKFDPITHQDFYSLEAIFAGVQHAERPLRVDIAERTRQAAALTEKIAQLTTALEPYKLKLRPSVSSERNEEKFPSVAARFVRFTVLATNDDTEPAIDELEIYGSSDPNTPLSKPNETIFVRRVFDVPDTAADAQPQLALLTVTCDDHAKVWINGKLAAANDVWSVPTQADVKQLVHGGRNVIAVSATNEKGPAGLLARLTFQTADNKVHTVSTGPNWRVAAAASSNWLDTSFDDASWAPAVSLGALASPPWGDVLAKLAAGGKVDPGAKQSPPPEWIWLGPRGFDSDAASNLARSTTGAKATASGTLGDNPLRHALANINEGVYGDAHSWVSDTKGQGWVQIELPAERTIERIEWGRDRPKRVTDRTPTRYRIEVSKTGADGAWQLVASSDNRLPYGADQDERLQYRQQDLPSDEAKRIDAQVAELKSLRELHQQLANTAPMVYAGKFDAPPQMFRLHRGDPEQKREPVKPDTLAILGTLGLGDETPEQARRVALAKWIASPSNPLTARVIVNRIWQHHFGAGIVDTPNDFGKQGSRPTHPELLDYLAGELVEHGWSMKHIHRLILNSATYRQSSAPHARGVELDPQTKVLWRYPPRRLEAEPIRDSILAVSGVLDLRIGGPGYSPFKPTQHHVRVYFPKERFGPGEWRRMIYMTTVRREQDAVFGAFDCPDGGLTCPKRSQSTTPLQAFNLLNSEFMQQQAGLLAQRLERDAGQRVADQVRRAFLLAFGRAPDEAEASATGQLVEQHGLTALCRAIFNANEFLFIP